MVDYSPLEIVDLGSCKWYLDHRTNRREKGRYLGNYCAVRTGHT